MRTLIVILAATLTVGGAFGQGNGKAAAKGSAKGKTAAKGKAATPACDRDCLKGWMDRYLDAMVAHDPSKIAVSSDFKFTENGQRLLLPDGLWNTMSGRGMYEMMIPDVEAQSIAIFATAHEMGSGVGLGVRLKIRDEKITEAEQFVQHSANVQTGFERIGYRWDQQEIPPAERMTREELIATANKYFSGMASNDGKSDYSFFADDCNRIESGAQSTNNGQPKPDPKTATGYSGAWGCREQFESGLLHFVTRIRDRRYGAVDPEHGIVYAYAFFDHSAGDTRNFETPDGRKVTAGPSQPYTWEITEVFRIEKGKIHQIEATMERAPYGMNAGWSAWEDGLSSRARDIAKQ